MQALVLSLVPQTSYLLEQNRTPKFNFFHADTYCAVCEDEVGGFSVTICTDLQEDLEIIQN